MYDVGATNYASDATRNEREELGSEQEHLSLAEATKLFPLRNGRRVTVATLKRRIKVGCRGVKLFGFLSGACWYTTRDAIERFHRELTQRELSRNANDAGAIGERQVNGRRTSRAARDYLKHLGIGSGNKTKRKPRKVAASG